MDASGIARVAVLGAGAMGAGIAQTCAQAGLDVAMRDIEQRFVDAGFGRITGPLGKRVTKGKMTQGDVDAIVGRIHGTVDMKEAVDGAQFVIEAVPEVMALKKQVYAELDPLCRRRGASP